MLSNRRIELLKHVRVSEVDTSIKDLYKLCASGAWATVELKEWFHNLTLNIILRTVAGKRYGGSDEDEKSEWQKAMKEFIELLGLSMVSDAFPLLERLDIGGHIKKMQRTAQKMDSVLAKWLEDHRRTMVSGATDTTIVVMVWAVSLLLNNPHVLETVQEELYTVIGNGRLPRESDINNLIYLQAVVKETLILYPPGPLLVPRECIKDCIVSGYHIPKGTRPISNVWKIQNDPQIWPDPSAFRPDRFLTTHKDTDVRGKHFELLPCGSGRRGCPGISFGLQVVHLALANFLHVFDVSTLKNAKVDVTESFGMANMKATPLDILIKPRIDIPF